MKLVKVLLPLAAVGLIMGTASPEFYRRITDNFKRAFESQGFSSFLIFSLLW